MIDIISRDKFPGVTEIYNSLTHGDPNSAIWNIIQLGNGVGYSVSKIINDPVLCEKVCLNTLGWLVVILVMSENAFSEAM